MKNPLEKFKHRNIAKVATAYAVVGWLMLQLTEIILPTFNAPQWIAQTIIFVVIMGFPIALLIAWASEMRSDHYDGNSHEDRLVASNDTAIRGSIPKKLFYSVGVLSISVIGLFAFYVSTVLFSVEEGNSFSSGNANLDRTGAYTRGNYRSFRSGLNLGVTGRRVFHNTDTDIAISADGMKLAFLRHGPSGTSELFLKDLGSLNTERALGTLEGTGGSGLMFFSQDNNWLHFISGGSLNRVRVEGGAFQTLGSQISVLRSGYTTLGDQVIFSNTADSKLYSISGSGMSAEPLPMSGLSDAGKVLTWPSRLPNSQFLLVTSSDSPDRVGIGRIEIYDVISGETRPLIETASNARYVQSGHVVFVREGALWAVPFDSETMEVTGLEVPVIQGIETNSNYGHATYSISSEGRLVYLPGDDGASSVAVTQLTSLSREGNDLGNILGEQQYGHVQIAPAGNALSVTIYQPDGTSDIWVYDLARKTLGRRTFEGKGSRSIWSADGQYLIYSYGAEGLRSVASDGTEPPVTIINTSSTAKPTSSTASGDIVFDTGTPTKIFRLPGGREANNEIIADELDLSPSYNPNPVATVSPDGNWIAYTSTESTLRHIFVRPYPEVVGGKWQVSVEPGFQAIWSHNSPEIFYWADGNRQFSVPYSVGEVGVNGRPNLIQFGVPKQIFARAGVVGPQTIPAWDYFDQDDSFVFLEGEGGDTQDSASAITELVVVENWFEELRALAPPDQL